MFAMAVGVEGEFGTGTIEERIEIFTEADIIYLPVTASILLYFQNAKTEFFFAFVYNYFNRNVPH